MKKALRANVKQILRSIPAAEVKIQSQRITDVLLPTLKPYGSVACYMSMDQGEVDTNLLMQQLMKNKTLKLYLPRCTNTENTGHMRLRNNDKHHPHLTFHKMDSWEQIQNLKPTGKYNLREPEPENPAPLPPALDVILVPGVAFDLKNGSRMGHGAGYYDDFFHRYNIYHHGQKNSQKPILIGLALMEQLVDKIPVEKHDYSMDAIVCGDGTIHWIKK